MEVGAAVAHRRLKSLLELVEHATRTFGDRPAYRSFHTTLSFRDLGGQSAQLGQWLVRQRFPQGSRIGVMLPNILQNPIAIAAVLRAGYIVVNINPLYTPRELAQQMNDSGAVALIALENFAHTIQKAELTFGLSALQCVVLTELGDSLGWRGRLINLLVRWVKRMVPQWQFPSQWHVMRWPEIVRTIAVATPELPLVDEQNQPIIRTRESIGFLQYTGGTTGVAKGAILTHGNILSNLDQCADWLEPEALERELTQQSGRPRRLTMVCALPLYHIFSLTACMMLGLKSGFKNLLLVNPRDLKSVISALSKEPVHLFPGVNTLFNALLNHPRFDEMNFSELKISVGGGMAVSASVATRWRQRTQSVLLEGYGLSETSPVVAATPRTLSTFTGSVGLPMPGTQIELREGEIVVKGPQVMQGYWNAPEETRAAFTADGFFKTGDIGAWDCDGYLHIVDRKKDMILVSGFNVYPNEIEQVVCDHPDVSECAAVGVPDAVTGEAVRIFVVKKSTHLTAEDLMAHCSAYLTNYKRPQSIHFIESLPKTAVGKILRRDLRALVTELSTGK